MPEDVLEISVGKVVRVIFLAREYGPDSGRLKDYVGGLAEDEQANLVALCWVGRETFDPEDWAEALQTAYDERSAPTEAYLAAMPELADYLEAGLEAMGVDVTDAEDHLREH
jgi:hypothetical protein